MPEAVHGHNVGITLLTSAAVAVTLSVSHARRRRSTMIFGVIAAVFVYTTIANIIERPEGVKIAACFIGGIILVSFPSRFIRAFERASPRYTSIKPLSN